MLGGTSNNSQTSTNAGWATIGLDLSTYETEYVRLKFVLEKNDISDPPVSADLQGWYIDGLRVEMHCRHRVLLLRTSLIQILKEENLLMDSVSLTWKQKSQVTAS